MARDAFFIVHNAHGGKFALNLFFLEPDKLYSMEEYFPLVKDSGALYLHLFCQTTPEKVLEFLGATIEEAAERHPFFGKYLEHHRAEPSHYLQMADYIGFYEYLHTGGQISSIEVVITDD